jgi:hypothetical protein
MEATINFFGVELDSSKEYELFKKDGLGFNITITYTENSWRAEKGRTSETMNNCTEFHWRFNEASEILEKESAFESDIHGTGCTRKIKEIKSVVIDYPTKIEVSY